MNAKPALPQLSALTTTVVAALAAFIAVGLFGAIAFLFQREGAPMEQMAAAERSCTQHAYVSEREACMRERIARERAHTGNNHEKSMDI
jgi:hypothetical protein